MHLSPLYGLMDHIEAFILQDLLLRGLLLVKSKLFKGVGLTFFHDCACILGSFSLKLGLKIFTKPSCGEPSFFIIISSYYFELEL